MKKQKLCEKTWDPMLYVILVKIGRIPYVELRKNIKNVCGGKPDNILELDRFVVCNLWLPSMQLKKELCN